MEFVGLVIIVYFILIAITPIVLILMVLWILLHRRNNKRLDKMLNEHIMARDHMQEPTIAPDPTSEPTIQGVFQKWERNMSITKWLNQVLVHNQLKHKFTNTDDTHRRALLMIHTEVTEFRYEYQSDTALSFKAEEELGDIILRTLDFCARSDLFLEGNLLNNPEIVQEDFERDFELVMTWNYVITKCGESKYKELTTCELLDKIHDDISNYVQCWRRTGDLLAGAKFMAEIVCNCCTIAYKNSIDLEAAMISKMEVNETRPPLHGKVW